MGLTIRQKINRSKLSPSERALRAAEIVEASKHGGGSVLTETGRRVVLDKLWEDESLRKAVLDDVKAANKAYKAEKEEE